MHLAVNVACIQNMFALNDNISVIFKQFILNTSYIHCKMNLVLQLNMDKIQF